MRDNTYYGTVAIFGIFFLVCWLIALVSHPVLTLIITVFAVIVLPVFLSSGKGDRNYRND